MPKGSNIKKGMRPGGRARGTVNRATLEKVIRAEMQTADAKARGLKLAVDVLQDYMHIFHREAEKYRPSEKMRGVKSTPREKKFLTYAKLTVDTANDLAAFQSPKFKAIQVIAPPPVQNQNQLPAPGSNVVTIDDPVAMARVYQQRMKQVR